MISDIFTEMSDQNSFLLLDVDVGLQVEGHGPEVLDSAQKSLLDLIPMFRVPDLVVAPDRFFGQRSIRLVRQFHHGLDDVGVGDPGRHVEVGV